MNKLELVKKIAEKRDVNEQTARDFLDATLDAIVEAITKGDDVSLVGFGRFTSKHRAERTGRNPQTGEAIVIQEKKYPRSKRGSRLLIFSIFESHLLMCVCTNTCLY